MEHIVEEIPQIGCSRSVGTTPFLRRVVRKLGRMLTASRKAVRGAFAKAVYSLPLVARYDPRTKVVSFREHCRTIERLPAKTESSSEDWYLRMRPRETVQRERPISLSSMEATKFYEETNRYQHGIQFEIPEAFLACIHEAKVDGDDFLVLSRENRILFESALSKNEVLETNGILDTVVRSSPRHLPGSYCLLAHPWAYAYYHWVIEVLPKLSLIEPFEELKAILLIGPRKLQAFQRESLAMLGIAPERIVSLNGGYVKVDRLFFPEVTGVSGNPSPEVVAWLRSKLLTKVAAPPSQARRCIYVSRRDAAKRRVLNEEEITRYLADQGFEIICPGELSFREQILTFSNVGLVVAAHGAGLTNMAFAPRGATLIELFGDNYINGCYWALANICGHRHGFLTGPVQGLDYHISIDELKALLEKIASRQDASMSAAAVPNANAGASVISQRH